MRVAVDMEMTLANTHRAMLDVAETMPKYDDNYSLAEIDSWDWVEREMDYGDFMAISQAIWKTGYRHIHPITARTTWWDTLTEEADVEIVTARLGVEREMKLWLIAYGFGWWDVQSIPNDETKAALGFDVFVDDKPKLAERISDDQHLYLIRHKYNQHVEKQPNVTPVDTPAIAAKHIVDEPEVA